MNSKRCTRCKLEKDLSEFPVVNKSTGKINSKCHNCKKEYDREYWEKTKHLRNSRKKSNSKGILERNARFIYLYLEGHPCIDCGEEDPIVLEFDHVRGHKSANVSDIARQCGSIETIKKEIDKCEVRCSNCHRRKTSEERSWFKFFLSQKAQKDRTQI